MNRNKAIVKQTQVIDQVNRRVAWLHRPQTVPILG